MPTWFLIIMTMSLIAICCAVSPAAVVPPDKPGMAVKVEAGAYRVMGRTVNVSEAATIPVDPPKRISIKDEEHVLSDDRPNLWTGGTLLKETSSSVEIGFPMYRRIAPESVRVHSEPGGGAIYKEGKDYLLDGDWGILSRLADGAIAKGARVYADYETSFMRLDAVQVSAKGVVTVKKGESVVAGAEIPEPDSGCTVLASVYLPYRTTAIEKTSIFQMPEKELTWQSFIRVRGRDRISHTLGLLKSGKPVTIVCWGDSVTCGGSSSSPETSYYGVFKSAIQAAYPKTPIKVINAGIGGSSTYSRLAAFDQEVLSFDPDLITIEFVNDMGLSPESLAKNYAEFTARARAKNPNVEFVLITPHLIWPEWSGGFKLGIPAIRKAAEDDKMAVADATNVYENLDKVGIPYMALMMNGINHPNDFGHCIFAECLMRLLAPRRQH